MNTYCTINKSSDVEVFSRYDRWWIAHKSQRMLRLRCPHVTAEILILMSESGVKIDLGTVGRLKEEPEIQSDRDRTEIIRCAQMILLCKGHA